MNDAAESLAHFNQPKDGTPTSDEMDLVKISSDVMVSFLEFILENPQTNSAHAFKAFQKGEIGEEPEDEPEVTESEYEF